MRALPAVLLGVTLAVTPATADAAKKKPKKVSPRLQAFESCTSLVRYARHYTRATGGSVGVPTRAIGLAPQVVSAPQRFSEDQALPAPTAAPAPSAQKMAQGESGTGGGGPEFSTTNVQEIGVDEPDIVKTNGTTLWTVTGNALRAYDVTGALPKLVGKLDLPGYGQQLLLRGNRLLVLSTSGYSIAEDLPSPTVRAATVIAPGPQSSTLSEVDVANPAAMVIRRTMDVPGSILDARLTGPTARIVVNSAPGYIDRPQIAKARVRTWVPNTTLRSKVTGRTVRRALVGCKSVRRPLRFSGTGLTTVLSVNLDNGLFDVDRDAVMAGADTIYGSTKSLYIASRRYSEAVEEGRSLPSSVRTQIHRFDASQKGSTSYASSGEVEGFVLNQYALSEHDGNLRVATTTEPEWFDGQETVKSQSYLTVLAEKGSRLLPLGRVGGLGKGERIYAVRYVGDKGYVVTFRQVDPLYTLDLSQPAKPRVVGELKIAGYSAYLHPISENLLLGVGQDATNEGRTLGTQLSLFNVADPAKPTRVAQARLGKDSSSDAEFDPHAFLYWDPAKLTLLPLQSYSGDQQFSGAVGFKVGTASLTEAGRITHPAQEGSMPPVARTVIVGDHIFSVSYAGLQSNRLDTLAPSGFAKAD